FAVNNGTSTTNVTVALVGNTATLVPTLDVGSYTITATYNGATEFTGSNSPAALSQVVRQASTTTTVSVAPGNPSSVGQPGTLPATVQAVAPGSGPPAGTVTFTVDGAATTKTLDGSGQVTLTVPLLAGGSHAVTATYNGSGNFATSTTALTQVVERAATATALTVSSPTFFNHAPVTLTATVASLPAGF